MSVEFDNVVYVCDVDANRVSILTTMKETAKYLRSVGILYEAFSVHAKGKKYQLQTLRSALDMAGHCQTFLQEMETTIRSTSTRKLPEKLNGTHGFVASKTAVSVDIIVSGLRRLDRILLEFDYTDINLLACLTIDVDHFPAATHFKNQTMSMQQYCMQFGDSLKESIKKITSWSANYYTGAPSYYPLPENAPRLADIPMMKRGPAVHMDRYKIEEMRVWDRVHGRVVRQRSTRQQTTMAPAGTLPSYVYEIREQANENSVSLLDITSFNSYS